MMRLLKPQPLTAATFAPYGDVIETAGRDFFMINNGSTRRYHRLADIDVDGGSAIISIFRAQPLQMPLTVRMMERHPLGSQAFMPLKGNPFMILVAEPGDALQSSQVRAFISDGQQGVNYHRGVWHHPVLACVADDDFLVVDRQGEGNNCDEFYFSEHDPLVLEPG